MNMEVKAMAIKHRIRKSPGDGSTKTVHLTPVKAIRYQCMECMGWSPGDVKECPDGLCPLHPYRMGNNPEREGIGWRRKEESLRDSTAGLTLDSQESHMN
jgi:hypothetical protein